MEMLFFGVLIGMIICTIIFGGGVVYADYLDKTTHSGDNSGILHPNGDAGCDRDMVDRDTKRVPTPEEIEAVLNNFRMGASETEKCVIDHILGQERRDNND